MILMAEIGVMRKQITVERKSDVHVQRVTLMRGNKRRNLENKRESVTPSKRIANYRATETCNRYAFKSCCA